MKNVASKSIHPRGSTRRLSRIGATLALVALALPLGTGCDEATADKFAAAALDSIQSGVLSIIEGLLDGAVAVAKGDAEGTDTSTDTSTTTGDNTGDTTGTGA